MYNAFEPFIKLTNANLALFNRFANSSDITRLMQDAVGRAMTIPQESMNKASQTNAYTEWTRGLVDNMTRFSQEYVNGVTQSMARTQNFLSRQVEQGSQQFSQLTQAGEQAADETTEAGIRSAKNGADRNGRTAK
jgi:hypothetical protein